jgi:L-ascorbate metabolism protein UlaG (beta-lactamase superfamily)
MRALKGIDAAFIPMNLPYTMSAEDAAEAVLAFRPKVVYPYHYRGQDGPGDVAAFKELVEKGSPGTKVVPADWYAGQ